jgi:DNA replication and repair protein RecF
MILRSLSLRDYRNYTALETDFASGTNILVGPNAQGKTNLLEAVYLLATTKSLRGARDQELIAWEKESAAASAEVHRSRRADVTVEVILNRGEKKLLRVNGVRQTRVMDFIGQLNAVAFSTSDIEVIRGEPALRRRFLDLEISQISPSYCHALAYYRKILEQRNQLLKQARDRSQSGQLEATLAAWDEQLISYGSQIVKRRAQFLHRLQEFARPIHTLLTEESEYLGLSYRPSVPITGEPSLEEVRMLFTDAVRAARSEELHRGVSVVGPHRDDLACLVNGYDVKTYGSQGQQRTMALSIKLAEVELIRDLTEEPPVCLLDDVMSELDERRRLHLFDVTMGTCQTLLTCTDLGALPPAVLRQAEILEVRAGCVAAVGATHLPTGT